MALALCACLIGLLALLVIRHNRRPEKGGSLDESENALDRGLSHLIKDISREPAAPPAMSRTRTIGDMTGVSVSARSRLARGTPADPVLMGSRLPAVTPRGSLPTLSGSPATPRTLTPGHSVATRLPSASMAIPRTLTTDASVATRLPAKTGFEADDDAPTTLVRTLPDVPGPRR